MAESRLAWTWLSAKQSSEVGLDEPEKTFSYLFFRRKLKWNPVQLCVISQSLLSLSWEGGKRGRYDMHVGEILAGG